MSKFSIAARIVELGEINTVRTSRAVSTARATETFLQRYFRARGLQRVGAIKSSSLNAPANSPAAGEKSDATASYKASPYDLASNNPYVIAATLFSRKGW